MWRCTGSYIRQALCDGVESIIAYFKTGGFFGGAFCEVESLSRQRFDADNQLLHAEGLFQIIVCTELKAFYNIVDGGTSRKEKHRGILIRLADAAHHFKTVHAGHHNVCHKYIGTQVEEQAQSFFAVGSGVYNEVLPFQRVFNNHRKGFFILN